MPIPYHPWSPITTLLLDPFVLFCLGCLITPLLVVSESNPEGGPLGTVTLREFDVENWKAHFSDPAVLAAGAFTAVAVLIGSDYPALPSAETASANWFLANGAIIHTAMDGMTGGLGFLPLMLDNYQKLDNRFSGTTASEDAVAIAATTFRSELFVMAPLCFLTYCAIYARSKFAPSLALVTLSAQLWGTVMFIGPEIMTGCKNMVPIGVTGCLAASFSPYELLYFWFAVGANFLWIIVPLRMMRGVAVSIASTANVSNSLHGHKALCP